MHAKKSKPKSKHTPGPWVVMPDARHAPRICVDGDKDWPIVVTISGHNDAGIRANEHLIAAAPEMIEALKAINDAPIWANAALIGVHNKIKAAIAKAEGRS